MSNWSWFYQRPRSEVHYAKYGTRAVPSRQYRFGGRRFTAAGQRMGLDTGSIWVVLAVLGLLYLASKKR